MAADYYHILGVEPTASDEQINAAYLAAAKQLHQRVNAGDDFAVRQMKTLNHAYDVLRDRESRQKYDDRMGRTTPQEHRKPALTIPAVTTTIGAPPPRIPPHSLHKELIKKHKRSKSRAIATLAIAIGALAIPLGSLLYFSLYNPHNTEHTSTTLTDNSLGRSTAKPSTASRAFKAPTSELDGSPNLAGKTNRSTPASEIDHARESTAQATFEQEQFSGATNQTDLAADSTTMTLDAPLSRPIVALPMPSMASNTEPDWEAAKRSYVQAIENSNTEFKTKAELDKATVDTVLSLDLAAFHGDPQLKSATRWAVEQRYLFACELYQECLSVGGPTQLPDADRQFLTETQAVLTWQMGAAMSPIAKHVNAADFFPGVMTSYFAAIANTRRDAKTSLQGNVEIARINGDVARLGSGLIIYFSLQVQDVTSDDPSGISLLAPDWIASMNREYPLQSLSKLQYPKTTSIAPKDSLAVDQSWRLSFAGRLVDKVSSKKTFIIDPFVSVVSDISGNYQMAPLYLEIDRERFGPPSKESVDAAEKFFVHSRIRQ